MTKDQAQGFLNKDGTISHRKLRRACGGRSARVGTKVASYRHPDKAKPRARAQVRARKREVLKALRSAT